MTPVVVIRRVFRLGVLSIEFDGKWWWHLKNRTYDNRVQLQGPDQVFRHVRYLERTKA